MSEFRGSLKKDTEFIFSSTSKSDTSNDETSSPEAMREQLRDPNFLPTIKYISEAFRDDKAFDQKTWDGKGSTMDYPNWHHFLIDKNNPVYELLNEEYLNALADYFVERIRELGATKDKPLVILEIGAGDGRLSHFLQKKIDEKSPGLVKIIASDSGDWEKGGVKPRFPVENLRHDEAIKKFSPEIVICSWMPFREDFSEEIRKASSVKEYVLVGEENGSCGDPWKTWGKHDAGNWQIDHDVVPPYQADGFEQIYLDDPSSNQISRSSDRPPIKYSGQKDYHLGGVSCTFSFRRKT